MPEWENTRVIKVDLDDPDIKAIRKAAEIIRKGGLVAFPTETVYGLGANALDEEAVAKIFAIKKRPASDPIIVHISDLDQLDEIVTKVPMIANRLAKRFWPGPLTLIMGRNPNVPANVSAGLPSVAVRMPSNPIALALIREAGVPVAAPSANIFSRPSSTRARHIIEDFSDSVDLIIDGGDSIIGVESTVLDLTVSPPVILRPGGTPMENIQELIPELQFDPKYIKIDEEQSSTSPGMLTKHYSPRAQVVLFKGPVDLVKDRIKHELVKMKNQGKKVGLLLPDEDLEELSNQNVKTVALGPEKDLATIARNLFSGMRELDRYDLDIILVRSLDSEGLGLAILDRMIRASEGKVVEV